MMEPPNIIDCISKKKLELLLQIIKEKNLKMFADVFIPYIYHLEKSTPMLICKIGSTDLLAKRKRIICKVL